MAKIAEETIEAVNAATDIVELISSYIPLKRAGGQYKALCPFHNERTPSFSINPQRQIFHCFGCGESGDAISFVRKVENLSFVDAVKKLAEKSGIPVIEGDFNPQEDRARRQRSRLIKLHNEAAQFLHTMLMRSPAAALGRNYLKQRGFGSEMAKRWMVGWMPDDYDTFLHWAKESGFKGRDLIEGSLAGMRDPDNPSKGIYAKFRNRLMFPIHNDYGDVIAFSGRQLIEDKRSGKYINSNETPIFKKSKVFFGLDKARKKMSSLDFALLCEGQIDVIACVEAGIENAVASLGTALTSDHARILSRYTKNATLCFDADSAGYKAAESAFKELIQQGISVKVVKMPPGEDPDTLINNHGIEQFNKLVRNALSFFDFKFATAIETSDLQDIQVKTRFSNEISELVALIPDKLNRDALIQQLAGRLGLGAIEFRESVARAEQKRNYAKKYKRPKHPTIPAPPEPETETSATRLDPIIGNLCLYALIEPKSLSYLCEQLEALTEPLKHLPGGHLLTHLLAVRPKCDTPAALNTFLNTLRESDRLGLAPFMAASAPEDILSATLDTTSMLLSSYLQRRDAAIRAALKNPDINASQTRELLEEAQEISELLRGQSQKFIR